jgi:bacillolysin
MRSSRAFVSVAALALLLELCAATTTTSSSAAVPAAEPTSDLAAAEAADRLLRADAVDPVTVSAGGGDVATFVGTLGAPVASRVPATATPAQAARGHLNRYGALFGVDLPQARLETAEVVGAGAGSHVVTFAQRVDGLPVLGGELAVSVDADGDLQSVNGETTEPGAVAPAPSQPAAAAVRTAVTVTARTHQVDEKTLTPGPATQWYYDPELIGSPDPRGPRPVWRVEVSNGLDIRELVLVDTATGGVAAHVNQVPHALDRVVCDRRNVRGRAVVCRNPVRTENSPPSAVGDVNAAFDHAGDTAALYRTLGVDITALIGTNTGSGKKLRSTVRFCERPRIFRCPLDNAFWNGIGMYYGQGFPQADDVVAHELTHGVIEHTSNLFYWYQSGAINESMADVFGEIVDQRNQTDRPGRTQRAWLLGEDSPLGALRSMRNPGQFRQPDRMRSRRYVADTRLRDFGGVHTNSGVGNKAAFLIADGGTFNGRTIRGLDEGRSDRTKTARIYLRTLRTLTSGSDYADLGRVLPQACRALIGTGARRITASDCVQVRRAVAATQMLRQPRVATAPEAPRCTPRNAASRRLFFDNMERATRRPWALGRLWFRGPLPQRGLPPYATSGRRSLFGVNPDPRLGMPRSSSLTLRRAIRVPRRGRTFLRFDHAHLFEFNLRTGRRVVYFDGGRVDVSTNGGRTWTNAAGLRWVNGPRQRIRFGRAPDFRGFGGDSHGYRSSRLELSRFAGRTVRLRWVVSGDSRVRFDGWWIDDVEAYTCRRRGR